jgi:hypothetical protein
VHLSCIKISTISKRTKLSFHLSLVTLEYHRVRPKWFLGLWYVWRKSCTYLAPTLTLSPNGPKWDSTWPTSPWSSIRCVQNNFWACGSSAQTMHLSCIKTSAVSKRTESSFYLSLITLVYHQMRWSKSCTYLAPTLTLSQNEPKRDSTWPTSPRSSIMNQASNWASSLRSTIKCVQNDFWALWYVWRKRSTYFALGLELSPNELNQASTWAHHLGVRSGASKMISEPTVCLAQTLRQYCTDTNTIQTDQNKIPHDPGHLLVPSGASKMISETVVRLAQAMHLSCVKISTISE